MKRFVEGEDRAQVTLLPKCLDDYIAEDNPVRVIDVFIDELDLRNLGFDGVVPAVTGRTAYHPAVLLKVYVYGYLNRVQSAQPGSTMRKPNQHGNSMPTPTPHATLRINRAPVLTLWAAVVAERLGMPHDTAMTVGQAVAGLTAHAKGVRLGIYAPSEERPHEPVPPMPKGATKVHDVALLGRRIHVADTASGQRAVAKGELVKPEAVEKYLKGKFGEALDSVRAEMEGLAARFSPKQLNDEGFHLYEQFRPEVPSDERGWGAKGVLDLAKIRALAEK